MGGFVKLSIKVTVRLLVVLVVVPFLSFSTVFAAREGRNSCCGRVSEYARRNLMGSARVVYAGTRRVEGVVERVFVGGFGAGRRAGRFVGREEAGGTIGLLAAAAVFGGTGAVANSLVISAVGQDGRNLLVIGASAVLIGATRLVRNDEERERVEPRREIDARVDRVLREALKWQTAPAA